MNQKEIVRILVSPPTNISVVRLDRTRAAPPAQIDMNRPINVLKALVRGAVEYRPVASRPFVFNRSPVTVLSRPLKVSDCAFISCFANGAARTAVRIQIPVLGATSKSFLHTKTNLHRKPRSHLKPANVSNGH